MPVTINGSDGITNASWTSGTRPSNPVAGQMGYNADIKSTEIYDGNDWVVISDAKQATIPIRQTVLFGPVDSAGRADFLEANSADLTISTMMLDVNPLKVTVALGFDPGPVNRTVSVESNQAWGSLVDNAVNYLGLRVASDGTITPVHTTSLDYGHTHPDSPSSGDFSFLIPAMQMFRYDGAEWVADPVVFVGHAETDMGEVVETLSSGWDHYAKVDVFTDSESETFVTNVPFPCTEFYILHANSEFGDKISVGIQKLPDTGSATLIQTNTGTLASRARVSSVSSFFPQSGGNASARWSVDRALHHGFVVEPSGRSTWDDSLFSVHARRGF